MTKIKFSELINISDLKTMVENLYTIAGIQFAIADADGEIHVAVGWQDICTKYHRANSISCERCKISDKYIKDHLKEGIYVAYKCLNNMWDVAMPIIISGEHVATVLVGQFFYEDEVIDVNEAAIRLYGYSKEELLRLRISKLVSKKFLNVKTEKLNSKIEKCNPLLVEGVITDKQRNKIWIEANHHLTTIGGKERVVIALRDITERKQAELASLNHNLELERLRTEFFANISHELRTPLNIIFSSNQVIGNYLMDADKAIDRKKIINNINIGRQNCFRLLRLINNLIDVTKMDSGLFEVNLVNCNIVNIVEEITLSTAEYIAANNLKLIFDTDVEEKIIACDPDKIERIILNLLSNCIKFTDNGGSIFVNVIDGEEHITITVEDTGIGIPEEKLNLIFERFRQVDKSFRRNQEGSGIGLSLVKSLVEMQGGNIFVKSKYKKGTKFTIKIPVQTLDSSSNEEQIKYNNSYIDNFVERINIEFSDIYK